MYTNSLFNKIKFCLILCGTLSSLTGVASAQTNEVEINSSLQPGHLRLMDNLDRPHDGYCLDIMGSGRYLRFDMPMTAHNCKPGLYQDEAVVIEPNGRIRFPAYNACATVAGLNKRALAGSAVMPRKCGERSPFLEADNLQRFVHHQNGQIELAGSGLCLTVGNESDSTFDETHRWRSLFVQHCDKALPSHSQWNFVRPSIF